MPKVKKNAVRVSGRKTKASKRMQVKGAVAARKTRSGADRSSTQGTVKQPAKKATATKGGTRAASTARAGLKKKASSARARRVVPAPVIRVVVKALDPYRKCGPGTSVQSLYRVDETVDGRSTAHLVFNDRHGWYCEHGRACPAVGYARKYDGRIARAS